MGDESNKLAVTVHGNNEITIRDERGEPHLCRDCRFSGWLTGYEWKEYSFPVSCLHHSGGADAVEGDRVIFDDVKRRGGWDFDYIAAHNRVCGKWRATYPRCDDKNGDGKCADYVKAKPLPWFGNFWKKILGREWRTKGMRK